MKIPNPKSEIPRKFEIRISKSKSSDFGVLDSDDLNFEIAQSFGFWISGFNSSVRARFSLCGFVEMTNRAGFMVGMMMNI